ncbi:DUF3993 domain-containing protein [Metabacillus litoralis]|uniref:DUF3993 domain-containing protein n=1 Tax=Metabacillus litoralis TaxID=152268 RepID=UPI001CFD83B3|nr:DUF3993 domain-containing protein [Metabacillus litoralis]
MGQVRVGLLLFFILFFSLSQQVHAKEVDKGFREEILTLVQEAFQSQISLTEEPRTKENIKKILEQSFEEPFISKYFNENVQRLDDTQYIVYGTDFPINTIPFFQYNQDTIVKQEANKAVVYEYFEANNEGPVSFDAYYGVVYLQSNDKGWKINEIVSEKRKPVIKTKSTEFDQVKEKLDGTDHNKVNIFSTSEPILFNQNQSVNVIEHGFLLSIYTVTKSILNEF